MKAIPPPQNASNSPRLFSQNDPQKRTDIFAVVLTGIDPLKTPSPVPVVCKMPQIRQEVESALSREWLPARQSRPGFCGCAFPNSIPSMHLWLEGLLIRQ
jgi:hypothetical protein